MGEKVTVLHRTLMEDAPRFDVSGGLGVGLLCLLISAWGHLVFFIAWQHLDGPAVDRFYFNLEHETPAIELTLSVSEALETPPAPEAATPDEILTPEDREAIAALEKFVESAAAQAQELSEAEPAVQPQEANTPETAAIDPAVPLEDPNAEAAAANPDPPLSVEPEAPAFKSYYTAIRRAINQHWVLPPEAKNQFRPSRLTCDFTIARDGTLLRIVVIESSGSATLDHAGLEALRAAAPFPPFTEELAAFSQLDIRMQFDYQARYISR